MAYIFARGFCERNGLELHTDPWVGELVFDISHPRCDRDLPRKDENTIKDGDSDISYRSYSQCQKCVDYYSLSKVREWLKFRPEIEEKMDTEVCAFMLAHQRLGDFSDYGYPTLAQSAYLKACEDFGFDTNRLIFVTEENPLKVEGLDGELAFVPDFYQLAHCDVLFRANSTFSFVASLLNRGRVFSPIIDGLHGGIMHSDVKFIEGLWPRLSHHDFCTTLNVKP